MYQKCRGPKFSSDFYIEFDNFSMKSLVRLIRRSNGEVKIDHRVTGKWRECSLEVRDVSPSEFWPFVISHFNIIISKFTDCFGWACLAIRLFHSLLLRRSFAQAILSAESLFCFIKWGWLLSCCMESHSSVMWSFDMFEASWCLFCYWQNIIFMCVLKF